jgi:hypothetical protein
LYLLTAELCQSFGSDLELGHLTRTSVLYRQSHRYATPLRYTAPLVLTLFFSPSTTLPSLLSTEDFATLSTTLSTTFTKDGIKSIVGYFAIAGFQS